MFGVGSARLARLRKVVVEQKSKSVVTVTKEKVPIEQVPQVKRKRNRAKDIHT